MPRRAVPVRLIVALLVLVASLWGQPGPLAHAATPSPEKPDQQAGQTLFFSYKDDTLLFPWQRKGAAAYLPPGLDPARPAPLFVFLHGINPDGTLHLWMGGGGKDLRPTLRNIAAEGPAHFVVVAPSQTRAAHLGRTLWGDFDLLLFLASAQSALAGKAKVDLGRVYVLGHSGAGCNPEGGMAAAERGSFVPAGVAAIDTCLDAEMGAAMGKRPASVKLWVLWQGASWPREPDEFRQAVELHQPAGAWFRMEQRPAGSGNPHDAIVHDAARLLLGAWGAG